MTDLWSTFSDSMRFDILGGLLMAVILGGAVGLERELQGKAAGLRTNVLICVGATLFTHLSIFVVREGGDPSRIAAQIVTGVGFIGAGTILRDRGLVTGLTSAATIWLVAAIGVAIGAGAVLEATGTTLLVVLVLAALRWVESAIARRSVVQRVTVEALIPSEDVERISTLARDEGLRVLEVQTLEREGRRVVTITAEGSLARHHAVQSRYLGLASDVSVRVEE